MGFRGDRLGLGAEGLCASASGGQAGRVLIVSRWLSLIACAPLRGLVADTRAADPLHLVTAWRNSPNTRTPPQSTVVPRRPVMPRPTGQVPLPACLLAAGV